MNVLIDGFVINHYNNHVIIIAFINNPFFAGYFCIKKINFFVFFLKKCYIFNISK
jgi:hypothetical protein